MTMKEELIRKLYQTLSLMACEARTARKYGTAHALTNSDMDLLKCVKRNTDAKASELSRLLGVTNGAVTQLAQKLVQKGYLEPYRTEGNKKEVYYRLTDCGQTACEGYDQHTALVSQSVERYLDTLGDGDLEKISGLFSVIADSVAVGHQCSIKQGSQSAACQSEDGKTRCEKCQRVY